MSLGQGNYTGQYISSETLLLSRDIRERVGMPYNEDDLLDFFIGGRGGDKTKRRLKFTKNTVYHWWEHDFLISKADIASSTGTSANGNPVTITITALPDNRSPFGLTDLVLVGGIQGIVTDFTSAGNGAHVYEVTPVDNQTNIVAATVDGQPMVWYGNAHADGTGLPASKVRKPIKYENNTQIIKTVYEADAGEAANMSEVTVDGGKKYYYRQGVVDLLKRHKLAIEYACIVGRNDRSLVDANNDNKPIKTTGGLEYVVSNNGINLSNGSFGYAQMQEIEREADKVMAPKEYIGMVGHELKLAIDSALLDKQENTGINYSAFGSGNAKGRAVDLGFDSYKVGSRTYHIKSWMALNYQPITGDNGYDMNSKGFFMPDDIVRQKGGEMADSICLRYKQSDQQNRFMVEETRGMKETGLDTFQYIGLSDVGLMTCLLPQYIRYTLTA